MALTKSKLTKAYHINVETLEVTDCLVGDYRTIYPLIGNDCSAFDCVALDNKGNTLFVDDEGLMKPNRLFVIKTDRGVSTLAGNAIVLGTNAKGESIAPSITKIELAQRLGTR
jgi:hypothetical protein